MVINKDQRIHQQVAMGPPIKLAGPSELLHREAGQGQKRKDKEHPVP